MGCTIYTFWLSFNFPLWTTRVETKESCLTSSDRSTRSFEMIMSFKPATLFGIFTGSMVLDWDKPTARNKDINPDISGLLILNFGASVWCFVTPVSSLLDGPQHKFRTYLQQFEDCRFRRFVWCMVIFQGCFKERGQSLWKQGPYKDYVFVHACEYFSYMLIKGNERCTPGPPQVIKPLARNRAVLETCSQSLLTSKSHK